jgi:hypothetical protein
MPGNLRWPALAACALAAAALAGCGSSAEPPAGAGKSASINLSLNTVPVIRSVTVSPAKATFGDCSGGSSGANTASASGKLGYPDGRCWYGKPEPGGQFPITITNTGIASQIDVSGGSAFPADNGDQWKLCNTGSDAAVNCTGRNDNVPGPDQYLVETFSPENNPDTGGITGAPQCDHQFAQAGSCQAVQGSFGTEGLELIGPESTTDNSTRWTVTITWMPVPQ